MSTAYCTEAEIAKKLSVLGIKHAADDNFDQESESGVVAEGIEWASTEIDFYCTAYAAADMATSDWVNQAAIIHAIYWLRTRRGEDPPKGVERLYEACVKKLELIHAGEYQIPGLAFSGNHFPAVTNVRADLRFRTKKTRVERPISSEQTDGHTVNVDLDSMYDNER